MQSISSSAHYAVASEADLGEPILLPKTSIVPYPKTNIDLFEFVKGFDKTHDCPMITVAETNGDFKLDFYHRSPHHITEKYLKAHSYNLGANRFKEWLLETRESNRKFMLQCNLDALFCDDECSEIQI